MITREEIINILKTDEISISFKKKNGELREMRCTLKPELLPLKEIFELDPNFVKKINENVINVYDLEKSEWRSFIINNLISINGVNI